MKTGTKSLLFVISEGQLKMLKGIEPFTTTTIRKEVRSRPLSEAIAEHNAGVIAELERLSKQNVGTQYRYALEEAIALIRDGVKHE